MIVKPHTKLRLGRWYQVSGDINPAEYGGTWCRELKDGRIEVFDVLVWEECLYLDGFPFEVAERTYDRSDLAEALEDGTVCLHVGVTREYYDLKKRADRFQLACDHLLVFGPGADYKRGFAADIIVPILGRAGGAKAFHKADRAYRRHLREVRK